MLASPPDLGAQPAIILLITLPSGCLSGSVHHTGLSAPRGLSQSSSPWDPQSPAESALDRASSLTASAGLCGFSGSDKSLQTRLGYLQKLAVKLPHSKKKDGRHLWARLRQGRYVALNPEGAEKEDLT